MKKIFLRSILTLFLGALPFATFAQGVPTVTFSGNPSVNLGTVNGTNATVSLLGQITLSSSVQISDAVVFVAYSESPIDASYEGTYPQVFNGSADPFESDFDVNNGNAFGGIINGFIPGHTYYFLFKTGLDAHPAPTGFVSDFATATITIPGGSTPTDDGAINPPCGGALQAPCGGPATIVPWATTTTITNPLGVDFDITNFFDQLFKNFVKIALPFLILFTVYSGFLFVEARGNEEKLAVAKNNFLYVIIGAAVVFGAWTIAHVLKGTVEQFEQAMNVLRLLV